MQSPVRDGIKNKPQSCRPYGTLKSFYQRVLPIYRPNTGLLHIKINSLPVIILLGIKTYFKESGIRVECQNFLGIEPWLRFNNLYRDCPLLSAR
jgi:hypothetical protein